MKVFFALLIIFQCTPVLAGDKSSAILRAKLDELSRLTGDAYRADDGGYRSIPREVLIEQAKMKSREIERDVVSPKMQAKFDEKKDGGIGAIITYFSPALILMALSAPPFFDNYHFFQAGLLTGFAQLGFLSGLSQEYGNDPRFERFFQKYFFILDRLFHRGQGAIARWQFQRLQAKLAKKMAQSGIPRVFAAEICGNLLTEDAKVRVAEVAEPESEFEDVREKTVGSQGR